MADRWTVRNVDPDALDLLREVQENCRLTMGELLSEAISFWYDSLPEGDEDDEDEARQIVSSDIGACLSVEEIAPLAVTVRPNR